MNKINISLVLAFIFLIQNIFAQSDSISFNKWNVTVTGGVIFPFERETYNNSFNTGIEFSYKYSPFIAIYLNGVYDFLKLSENFQDFKKTGLLEITIGAKFYPDGKLFFRTGLGYYQRFDHYLWQGYDYTNNYDEFGLNTGIGGNIKINKKFDAIVEAKLHFINFLSGGEHVVYWGLYTGVNYKF